MFKKAFEIAKKYQNTSIIPEHLLLALVWEENSEAVALLKNYDVDIDKLKQTLIKLLEKKKKKARKTGKNQNRTCTLFISALK